MSLTKEKVEKGTLLEIMVDLTVCIVFQIVRCKDMWRMRVAPTSIDLDGLRSRIAPSSQRLCLEMVPVGLEREVPIT